MYSAFGVLATTCTLFLGLTKNRWYWESQHRKKLFMTGKQAVPLGSTGFHPDHFPLCFKEHTQSSLLSSCVADPPQGWIDMPGKGVVHPEECV